MAESRLVYSTDAGDRRHENGQEPADSRPGPQLPADGVVRVFREKGGRNGKTVTIVRGLPPGDLKVVGRELKRLCGSGGTVSQGAVEIQGDHREKVAAHLASQAYRVKLAGG